MSRKWNKIKREYIICMMIQKFSGLCLAFMAGLVYRWYTLNLYGVELDVVLMMIPIFIIGLVILFSNKLLLH